MTTIPMTSIRHPSWVTPDTQSALAPVFGAIKIPMTKYRKPTIKIHVYRSIIYDELFTLAKVINALNRPIPSLRKRDIKACAGEASNMADI